MKKKLKNSLGSNCADCGMATQDGVCPLCHGKEPGITVSQAIKVLNEALKSDPLAIEGLFSRREFANDDLANHPTIQVGTSNMQGEEFHTVRFIGILNGIFGVDAQGNGYIAEKRDESGMLIGFCRRANA